MRENTTASAGGNELGKAGASGAVMTDEIKNGRRVFDPTINLGHIMTLTGVMVAIIGGWYSFNARLELVERQIARQTVILELSIRSEEQIKALIGRVERLERIR